MRGRGVGRLLYERLEEALKQQNVQNVNACIAYPNPQSIAFHEKMGYRAVGKFTDCAYKLEQWLGMIWMEKCWARTKIPRRNLFPTPKFGKKTGTKLRNFRQKG